MNFLLSSFFVFLISCGLTVLSRTETRKMFFSCGGVVAGSLLGLVPAVLILKNGDSFLRILASPIPGLQISLMKTYEAVPDPKIVIAVGACAINGGPFEGRPVVSNGVDTLLPVDLYIPGCPPHPLTILDGLLRLLGRIENEN